MTNLEPRKWAMESELPENFQLPENVQFLKRIRARGRRWWEYYFVLDKRAYFLLVPHNRAIMWKPVDAPWIGFYGNSDIIDAKDTAINWYNSDVNDMRAAMEDMLARLPNEYMPRLHVDGCHAYDPCDACTDAMKQVEYERLSYLTEGGYWSMSRQKDEPEEKERLYDEAQALVVKRVKVNDD